MRDPRMLRLADNARLSLGLGAHSSLVVTRR
jgi:hypothetical protein